LKSARADWKFSVAGSGAAHAAINNPAHPYAMARVEIIVSLFGGTQAACQILHRLYLLRIIE
jgi:hypothetical protein